MIQFKEVSKTQLEKLDDTSELCWFCCHCGDAVACGAAPCMPHQREDKKRGYFDNEVAPTASAPPHKIGT